LADFSCANLCAARLTCHDLWRQLGLGMERCDLVWPATQPRLDEWRWQEADLRLRELANAGVAALVMIRYGFAWATTQEAHAFEEARYR
jgi:hypothetical protein